MSATGPKRLVENICCHTLAGQVLDGSDGGDSRVVHEDVGCADRLLDRLGGTRRSTRGLPGRVGRRAGADHRRQHRSPRAGVRVPRRASASLPTTRHPSPYRCAADARPSPRDAPVMTTLRGSCIAVGPAVSIVLHRIDGRAAVRLRGHPAVPVALEVRARLPRSLVEALRVVDLRFGIRPRAGDRGREPRRADRGEAGAVRRSTRRSGSRTSPGTWRAPAGSRNQRNLLRQLLGLRASGVVAVAEDACGNHHRGDERRLPDQRELEGRSGEERAPRNHLRVDVEPRADEEDLEEARRSRSRTTKISSAEADERVAPHERRRWLRAPAGGAGSRSTRRTGR